MSFEEIHQSALLAALEFKQAEKKLLFALIEVEKNSVHLRMGFSSLFQYAVSSLGLSEAVAYNAIAVARKFREIPELPVGEVGISKIRKIVSVLTSENQEEWISKAKTLSSRALEKEVAKVNPKAATPEKAHYVSEKRLDLRLGMDEDLMLKLRRAQDQVSQSLGKPATLEETLGQLVTFYLKHKDPLEKARRIIAKKGSRLQQAQKQSSGTLNKLFTGTVETPITTGLLATTENPATAGAPATARTPAIARTPIPKATEYQVRLRDLNQCQAPKPGGGICGSQRWIDLHHKTPVSQGGTNTKENLITLCKAHHRLLHAG